MTGAPDRDACERVRPLLTGYLDGDLEDDAGAAVRGHLRECAACRDVAADEAALRDGLRALPTVDPPASLWLGVRAQLAQAEVDDAHRPAWRRAMARWAPQVRAAVPYAGALAAAAVALVIWRGRNAEVEVEPEPSPVAAVVAPAPPVAPHEAPQPLGDADVTADLARDGARRDASYRDTATDLERELANVRAGWPDDRKRELDTRLGELTRAVDAATDDRARHAAWRAKVRYLQRAVVREEVALADVSGAPGAAP